MVLKCMAKVYKLNRMKTSKEIYLRKGIILVSSVKYYLSNKFILKFQFSENDEYSPESFRIDSGFLSSVC